MRRAITQMKVRFNIVCWNFAYARGGEETLTNLVARLLLEALHPV
jgi:hypothetical protein